MVVGNGRRGKPFQGVSPETLQREGLPLLPPPFQAQMGPDGALVAQRAKEPEGLAGSQEVAARSHLPKLLQQRRRLGRLHSFRQLPGLPNHLVRIDHRHGAEDQGVEISAHKGRKTDLSQARREVVHPQQPAARRSGPQPGPLPEVPEWGIP